MAYDEDEQVERLQKWWSENWKPLIGGLVLGIGGIVGWNAWQAAQEPEAEAASNLFRNVVEALDAGRTDGATSAREALVADYAGTPYAVAASLRLAAARVEAGELDAAADLLGWARDHTDDPAMAHLATLRLARVRWAQGDADAALAMLDEEALGPFIAVGEELRGDILVAQGQRAEALAAYRRALSGAPPESRELLQQKVDDLADVAEVADA